MRHTHSRCLLSALLASALSVPAICRQGVTVAGQVVRDGGPVPSGLTAELYDPTRGVVLGRSQVQLDGAFRLSDLPAGEFVLRLTGPSGVALQQTLVSLKPNAGQMDIRLPLPPHQAPVTGTISAAHLRHKIPPKALRELRQEEKALRGGDLQGSIAHLEQALKIDPDCMEAHNNLGTRYMNTGEFDKAAAEFQKAVTLDPTAPDALLNWTGALYALRRYDQAEAAARRALARTPGLPRAQYALGLTLLAERKSEQECLRALESAAAQYPKAHTFAEELRRRLLK